MACSTLIYFGRDLCYRMPVMRNAGYEIAECVQLPELSAALSLHPDAVLLTGEAHIPLEQVIGVTRAASQAPLILFMSEIAPPGPVDLVIPVFTLPEQWLHDIGAVIERFHQVQTGNWSGKKTGQMSTTGFENGPALGRRLGDLEQMPSLDWRRRDSG